MPTPPPDPASAAELTRLRAETARTRLLLDRTLRVTLAEGLAPVAHEVLDAMMEVVAARRGFVGLGDASGWSFLVARNLARNDLSDPAKQVSTSLIDRALRAGTVLVCDHAAEDFDDRSIVDLALRSVVCVPVVHGRRTLGFIYLDDAGTEALFDEAAVAALTSWVPMVASCLARATATHDAPGLPGVITRSAALTAVLDELVRIARFDASILLTGETGTGKSLIARGIHSVSPRAAGPFVHLNCGAIPEALLEAELFGAEVGAYTGSRARRIGKLEAANGGTLFLDELDTLPLSCQVKLLVALQERVITRLGANNSIAIDVRVISAMGSDPFVAMNEGRLREDLYYRVALAVARVPALRERKEDIPLLTRHILQRSESRYGLPPLRLSPAAEVELQGHDWPGNVRELENTLDRAALLSRDGTLERLALQRGVAKNAAKNAEARGVVALLQAAATALAESMHRRPELRSLALARAFEGAVLLALTARFGGRDAAFEALGRGDEVRARNHNRTFNREVGRLQALADQLGERVAM